MQPGIVAKKDMNEFPAKNEISGIFITKSDCQFGSVIVPNPKMSLKTKIIKQKAEMLSDFFNLSRQLSFIEFFILRLKIVITTAETAGT